MKDKKARQGSSAAIDVSLSTVQRWEGRGRPTCLARREFFGRLVE